MLSYEERLQTFANRTWGDSNYKNTPELLAICGFICENNELGTKCVYCKKRLEGWEKDDIVIQEHFAHKKDCVLFSPNLLKSRLQFFDKKDHGKAVAKHGFIRYDIKKNVPFIFCYKCGSTRLNHVCKHTKRFKLDLKTPDNFFIKMISGNFMDFIYVHVHTNLLIPPDIKYLLSNFSDDNCAFETLEAKIEYAMMKCIKRFKSICDEDTKKLNIFN